MFSIGEFSIVTGISKKTLRYYDEIDLLKPEKVQESNQYRRYSKNQLEKAVRIVGYRNMGISLKSIGKIISSEIDNIENKYLQERINDIDEQIRQLEHQKKKIYFSLQNDKSGEPTTPLSPVRETIIEEDSWVVMDVESELSEIHTKFSDFYEMLSIKDLHLKGNHMIKISEEQLSIVARVESSIKEDTVIMPKQQGVILENIKLANREKGYMKIVEYGRDKNYIFDYFLESYVVVNGEMQMSITGVYKTA